MKKLLAVLLCAMLVSGCALTASAYDSPGIHGDTDSNGSDNGGNDDGGKTKTSDSDKKGSDSDKKTSDSDKSSSNNNTSPKTGVPVSYGVLMAAAALAFGGVALSSKKKIEEN